MLSLPGRKRPASIARGWRARDPAIHGLLAPSSWSWITGSRSAAPARRAGALRPG